MSYRIWFKVEGYDEVKLPVNPSDLTITYPGNPTNYDVEGIGDIVIPRLPKLATFTVESFFPREQVFLSAANPGSRYTPEWYVTFFRNVQKSRRPFSLTIVRGSDPLTYTDNGVEVLTETNYFDTVFEKVVLLDFSITDKGGEPGDVYYSMTMSEYKDASPKRYAELMSEEVDDNGVLTQKMVMVVNRPPQTGAIVPDRTVQINGEVYEQPETTKAQWGMSRQKANQIDRLVTRVLPPSVSGSLHSVYVNGLGWVDQNSCKLSEQAGTSNNIKRLVTNEYD